MIPYLTNQELLEESLREDFDNITTHAAYADLLSEKGDPRGEYIRLRLVAEDPNNPPHRIHEALAECTQIYQTFEREWLGDLTPFLAPRWRTLPEPDSPDIDFGFRRGWLWNIDVDEVREAFTMILAEAPEVRMLNWLRLRRTRGRNESNPLRPLTRAKYFQALRTLEIGDASSYSSSADAPELHQILQCTPRLQNLIVRAEEIPAEEVFRVELPHIERVTLEYVDSAPLEILALNPSWVSLKRLGLISHERTRSFGYGSGTSLREFRPCDPESFPTFARSIAAQQIEDFTYRFEAAGDPIVHALIRSGFIQRLKKLDLRNCGITDEGAQLLAQAVPRTRLMKLDVGHNRITESGLEALRNLNIEVHYDSQETDFDEGNEDIPF